MANRRIFTAASAASALGATLLGPAGLAHAQQGQPRQDAVAVLGGLIDVVVQNVQVNLADSLNNLLRDANIQVLNLNNVLNGNEVNLLSGILNNSNVLSNNRDVLSNILNNSLNNNDVLKNFLNNNNIDVNAFVPVAVNLLSAPVTVYFFDPR
jgi:hypothetical protein